MKKLISFFTAGIMCMGMSSFSAYARETLSFNSADELCDYLTSDGNVFSAYDCKIDVYERENSCDMIIYGLKSVDDIFKIFGGSGEYGYHFASYPEFHSGICMQFGGGESLEYNGKEINYCYFFVDNTLTDCLYNDETLLDAAQVYDFDVAPYVCTNIIPGDTDFDGTITPADASTVLSAYAELSTGEKLVLNSTIFDYNNDSEVDPSDASAILTKYAELSTLNPDIV